LKSKISKNSVRSKLSSAAPGGGTPFTQPRTYETSSKFPETPVLLILQSKINKTGVSGKYSLAAQAAKRLVRQPLRTSMWHPLGGHTTS
jgi:hypothetical protein